MDKQEHLALVPLFDELRGERVVVRPYRQSDAQDLWEAINESREHLRPWMPWADTHQSVEETMAWIIQTQADWLVRKNMTLGMWDAGESGKYVGGTGLHPRDWTIRYFEIGYWLRKSAEGRGYVTEAVKLLTDFGMNELKASRLMIRCDELNTRSAAVARRAGYVFEGTLRNDLPGTDGTPRNMLIFSRIPGDK